MNVNVISFVKLVADAWGKIPSGILQGNFFEFGSYDQCLAIKHDTEIAEIGTFKGQYCLAKLGFKASDSQQKFNRQKLELAEKLGQGLLTRAAGGAVGYVCYDLKQCDSNLTQFFFCIL